MKVCLFSDSFLPIIGGMEFVIHHLANTLYDIGCEVTVIAKRVEKKKGMREFEHKYNLVRYGSTFPGSGRTGYDNISSILTLMMEHKKRHFNVINCHSVDYAGTRACFAKKFIKVPTVMTPHGEDVQRVPEIGYGYRLSKRWDRIIRRNLYHADAITAISDAVKNELNFIPDDKIFIIPNGINTAQFSAQKNNYLHDLLSIDLKTKIVLSVGRNHIKKGYEYGIKAFEALNKMGKCRDLVYVIIGKDTQIMEPMVQRLSLNEKVFLLPQQDQETILRCYQSGWCFFSPSIIEGLSLVSIEAMAAGLPLIVTDVPGNIDIVRDNQCGLIVRNKDPLSMVEGIISLTLDQKLYNSFSEIALKRTQLYDWRNIANKYLEVYRIVIDRYNKATTQLNFIS